MEEQSGFNVGKGGMNVNIQNHTHLKGGLIQSEAEQSKNQFSTNTLSHENIENRAEVKVENYSAGFSNSMVQSAMTAAASAVGALGNKNESRSSTTKSAVGENIVLNIKEEESRENLTALSRDTENANQKVETYNLQEIKEQQEMAQVIGEISQNTITLTLKPKLDDAEKILKDKNASEAQKAQAKATIEQYGQGSDMQMAIRAVTGLLQGLATENANAAAVGLLSPYANKFIKEQTGDNTAANLMAHALLGAIEAQLTGTNALAGAAGAFTSEASAHLLAEKLYNVDGKNKTVNDLTESEKQTLTALSQLAGGLAGGLVGNNTASAMNSAEIGKRAVENNFTLTPSADWLAAEEAKQKIDEAQRLAIEQFEKAHPELVEALKTTGDVAAFLADFTPVVGDVKSFAEAEDAIDYAIAIIGLAPGSEVATKPLKAAKLALQNAKEAERLGNAAEALKYQNEFAEQLSEYTQPLGSRYNQMNQPKNPNYQPVRNSSSVINGREYSGHALDRMQDRGIMPSVVENAIKFGNKLESRGNTNVYVDNINGIKVVVNSEGKVITVTYGK